MALPALALTVACDLASLLIDPGYYGACCGWELSYPGARILFNALFLNEIWGLGSSPAVELAVLVDGLRSDKL